MSKYTLLTGSTGLVGRYLVRDLLLEGKRLALIIRPSKKESVRERVESILQMWESQLGVDLSRPVWFEGDVSEDGLGLSAEARRWIKANCDRVIHNAAVLAFHGSDRSREPWRTNVDGTRRLLALCRELKLLDLHYVSTAYVCGTRAGTIYEDEFDLGQGFRNDYEESKFEAERLVREAEFLDRTTIYRPGVISGDSRTGYTNTYHGLYLYLRLISLIVPLMPKDNRGVRQSNLRLNMNGDVPRNIVPVDWVSKVICRLSSLSQAHGQTYHLTPQHPITTRGVIDFACRYFNTTNIEYCGDHPVPESEMTDLERNLHTGMAMYESYASTDPHFDTSNLLRYTSDVTCPVIDDEMLTRYVRFCEADRWGKKRAPKPNVPFCVGGYLNRLCPEGISRSGAEGRHVGLDVAGPGGGQWRVWLHDGCVADVEPGLPSPHDAILRLTSNEFNSLVRSDASARRISHHLHANGRMVNGELSEEISRALLRLPATPLPSVESQGDQIAELQAPSRASSND